MSFSGNNGRAIGAKNKTVTVSGKFSIYEQVTNEHLEVYMSSDDSTTIKFGTLSVSLTKAGMKELQYKILLAVNNRELDKVQMELLQKTPLKL